MNRQALQGHGHVYPRADGFKARCGGPTYCEACLNDLTALESADVLGKSALRHQYSDPNHVLTQMLDAMRTQLLIVMANRLGGRVEIPVSEVDATGLWMMNFTVDQERRVFVFETQRKD